VQVDDTQLGRNSAARMSDRLVRIILIASVIALPLVIAWASLTEPPASINDKKVRYFCYDKPERWFGPDAGKVCFSFPPERRVTHD
jgi:hypothetical protein